MGVKGGYIEDGFNQEMSMGTMDVFEEALKLKAPERFELIELLHISLDKPDAEIDRVWQEEAMRRVKAYDEGRLECISMEEAFRDL